MKRLRIGFYSPYLDTIAGGERYLLTLAGHWSKEHEVVVFWDDPAILKMSSLRLNLDLSRIRVTKNIFASDSFLRKLLETSRYDLLFILSDGSVPTSLAKHNILHFQMPFTRINVHAIKLRRYDAIVCNSQFTKQHLVAPLGKRATVIYPPVPVGHESSRNKKKIILTVGRFTGSHNVKKQDVLMKSFKEGYDKKFFQDWKMVCVGGLLKSDNGYFKSLQKAAAGYPIELVPNSSYDKLQNCYRNASIYWHGAGYGQKDAMLMEHFGISTVEAMSHGCIPVVYNGGGQEEIVRDGKNGFLWNTTRELLDKTLALFSDKNIERIRSEAVRDAGAFDEKIFFDRFDGLLKNLCH